MSKLAVVGCGVGGLATACLLRDQGHEVTIFDQFPEPRAIGSGLIIQPIGQEILSELGILGACLSHGVKIHEIDGRASKGGKSGLTAKYDLSDKERFGLALDRRTVFDLLLKAARARQIQIQSNQLVLNVHDGSEAYLRIEGRRQAGPFDLIIDASGAQSQLSPILSMEANYGILWCVVDLPAHDAELGNKFRQKYLGARQMAAVLPVGTVPGDDTPRAALFWSLKPSDYEAWQETDIADWKVQAAEMWPEFGMLLEQITSHDEVTYSKYGHASMNRLYSKTKRVAFVGDAAHRSSPHLGQGANMALLDAAVLAESIAMLPMRRALARYSRKRFLHIKTYQVLSGIFSRFYQSDRRIYAMLRDRVLGPITGASIMKPIVSKVIRGELVAPFGRNDRDLPDASGIRDILRGPGE